MRSPLSYVAGIMDGSEAGDNRAPQPRVRFLGSEGADDGAHDGEHHEPMGGIDDCHNGLGAVKGLVGGGRGQHEADPDEEAADDAPRTVTSARWPISPASIQAINRHPMAAMMKGRGVGLQSSFFLPSASCQTLPKIVYQPQPTRNPAMAAMTTAR